LLSSKERADEEEKGQVTEEEVGAEATTGVARGYHHHHHHHGSPFSLLALFTRLEPKISAHLHATIDRFQRRLGILSAPVTHPNGLSGSGNALGAPDSGTLGRVHDALNRLNASAEEALQKTALDGVYRALKEVPGLSCWSQTSQTSSSSAARGSGNNQPSSIGQEDGEPRAAGRGGREENTSSTEQLELPTFSAYPQSFATAVGECLMELPSLLEPLTTAQVLAGGTHQEEKGPMDEAIDAAAWLDRLAQHAVQVVLAKVGQVPRFSPMGRAQLHADLEYIAHVLRALGMDLPPALAEHITTNS